MKPHQRTRAAFCPHPARPVRAHRSAAYRGCAARHPAPTSPGGLPHVPSPRRGGPKKGGIRKKMFKKEERSAVCSARRLQPSGAGGDAGAGRGPAGSTGRFASWRRGAVGPSPRREWSRPRNRGRGTEALRSRLGAPRPSLGGVGAAAMAGARRLRGGRVPGDGGAGGGCRGGRRRSGAAGAGRGREAPAGTKWRRRPAAPSAARGRRTLHAALTKWRTRR